MSCVTPSVCLGDKAIIRANHGITGIRRGPLEDKIALYVDDMLLFLEDSSSLVEAIGMIKHYGGCLGLSINWDKSVLIPVDGQMSVYDGPRVHLFSSPTFKLSGHTHFH